MGSFSTKTRGNDLYVVCDNIRSAENIGSVFRTADALGVKKIYLCGICPVPPNPKVAKTALGAQNHVPFEYHKQSWRLTEKLQKEGIVVVALEQTKDSVEIGKFTLGLRKGNYFSFPDKKSSSPGAMALVVGHEVKGVSKKVLQEADAVVHLPMRGRKESLNVAVAFGAAGYLLCQ